MTHSLYCLTHSSLSPPLLCSLSFTLSDTCHDVPHPPTPNSLPTDPPHHHQQREIEWRVKLNDGILLTAALAGNMEGMKLIIEAGKEKETETERGRERCIRLILFK